jgi:uncharacterized protein with GYD domain
MVKFLITGSYTADGAKALAKEGGSKRKAAVEKMLGGLGGKLEAFYFAFGDSDIYAIVDVPDTTSGAALTLAVNASGMVKISSVMLMTPEEVDAACKKAVSYRPPGS